MKNTLIDLNDHLFAQLERLSDETLKDDALKAELDRSKAITDVSKEIVSNAALQLRAIELKAEYRGFNEEDLPRNLIGKDG